MRGKEAIMVEEKTISANRQSLLWIDDPKLAELMEVAKHVMERYSETSQRLADS